MTGNIGKMPDEWRNFGTTIPLRALRISRGDLRRLYQIINQKQLEYRDRVAPILVIQDGESEANFAERRARVLSSFVTSTTFMGINNEKVTGNSEQLLDSPTIPERLKSIFISTISAPKGVTGITPLCNITIFLDFTQPPLFDFSRLPTFETPNASNIEINADDEPWFTSANAHLTNFFRERYTSYNWLHGAGVYDVLVIFIGLPISIWTTWKLSGKIEMLRPNVVLLYSTYIYSVLLSLSLFRIVFSYTRWVFPKMEMESERSHTFAHRLFWSAIVLSLAGSFAYDAIRALL